MSAFGGFAASARQPSFGLPSRSSRYGTYKREVDFRDSYSDLAGMLPLGKASFNRVRAVRGGL